MPAGRTGRDCILRATLSGEERRDLLSDRSPTRAERSENVENFSATPRPRREDLGVERVGVSPNEEIVDQQHGHAHEAVFVDEIALRGGVIQCSAIGVEANDLGSRLDQEPSRTTRDGQRGVAIDGGVLHETAVVVDSALREELSRACACRSAVAVVEDGARHGDGA